MGWTYTFLSDEKAEVLHRYDLHQPMAGAPAGIARPAELLIAPTGTVRWRDLTDDYRVRARPEAVLDAFDRIAGSRG
jgi:peroxiredoxin